MLEHSSVEEVLERAREAGLSKMITVSTEAANWESNRLLAEKYPHIYYSLGVHPHEVRQWVESAPTLRNYFEAADKTLSVPLKCVAIGEIGLDFYYDFCPQELQIDVFEAQLKLAKEVNLPVIIHCRDAFAQLFESIQKVGLGSRSAILHCFTGTVSEAQTALEVGLKISFSGILTFKNAEPLREAARAIPLSELMIETDCPYLAPIPYRGKPNEPAYLSHTASVLAEIKGVTVDEIALQTSQNAIDFFELR